MAFDTQEPLQPTFRTRASEAITTTEAATTVAEITTAAEATPAEGITGVTESAVSKMTNSLLTPPVVEGRAIEEGAAAEEDQTLILATPTLIPMATRMIARPLAPRTNTHQDSTRKARAAVTNVVVLPI